MPTPPARAGAGGVGGGAVYRSYTRAALPANARMNARNQRCRLLVCVCMCAGPSGALS